MLSSGCNCYGMEKFDAEVDKLELSDDSDSDVSVSDDEEDL